MRFLYKVFIMLYTEDFSMRHYVGFSQNGSHIVYTHKYVHTYTHTVFIHIKARLIYMQGIKYTLSIAVE